MRNDHIRQETKEKCQPWNDREIGGRERETRERGKRPKKNVNHGMTEKSGVDPPPSPTTPASYIQLFCNLRQVQHYGTTYRNKHVSYNTHVFLIKI